MLNPLAGPDHEVAGWFHAHLTRTFVSVLRAFTEFGSSEWIGIVLFFMVLYFVWKKYWPSLVTLVVAVPGGMLLNEWVKIALHWRTCHGALGIRRKTRAESPELIRSRPASGLPARDLRISLER